MTSQTLNLSIKGLYTSPNQLNGIPPGALDIADNLVINSLNLLESRRGQTQYGSPLTIGSDQVNRLFNYASSLIVNYASKMAYDSGSGTWVDYSGTYLAPSSDARMRSLESLKNFYFTTSAGIYKLDSLTATPRPAGSPKALGGVGTLSGSGGFLANNTAVAYRLVWGYIDANNNLILGSPSQRVIVENTSGGAKDVSLTFQIPDTITTSFFYQIYRSLPVASGDTPSDELQLALQYSPSAADITAKAFTIVDSTPDALLRATLYTSPSQEGIANSNNQPPFCIDMDIFKGCAFYANTRQKQTLSLAMISVDLPSFGYLVDASVGTTSGSPVLTGISDTSDLAVGARAVGTGIPVDSVIKTIDSGTQVTLNKNATATATVSVEFQDRFSIGGVNYWGGTAQDAATNTFLVDISADPGSNIGETALNLVNLINVSTLNTLIYAYYISGTDDLPGQMLFEERAIGGAAFSATSTKGGSFSPTLSNINMITAISMANPTAVTSTAHGLTTGNTVTIYSSNSTPTVDGERTVTVTGANTFTVPVNVTVAGTTGYWIETRNIVSSNNDAKTNRVFISKQGQVEAVPVYRFFDIGSANFPIQRVVALRDGIFFFKRDGVYRLSGETFENFTVNLLDNTVVLTVPESAVPFNNQVFCFTTQGIAAVTDAGIKIMSVPIENVLLELASPQFTSFTSASFGVAYESARIYMFCTVTEEDDTFATQAFIYNSLTDSWTRWVMNRTCGIVNTTVDKLFMAQAETGQILIERKSFTVADYADEQYAVTINTVVDDETVVLASATNVVAGMTLVQGFREALILEVSGTTLTLVPTTNLMTGAATVYQPIENKMQWVPIDCENPGILKQFSEISLMFKNAAFREIDAGFQTNVSPGNEVVAIRNFSSGAWGGFPWGEVPWGGVLGGQNVLRTYVPRQKQRASWVIIYLRTEQAFTGFSLQGISLIFNPMSSRLK